MNIHKNCIKIIDEVCMGPIRQKKDKKKDRMSGIMENIIGKNRKPSSSVPLSSKFYFHRFDFQYIVSRCWKCMAGPALWPACGMLWDGLGDMLLGCVLSYVVHQRSCSPVDSTAYSKPRISIMLGQVTKWIENRVA